MKVYATVERPLGPMLVTSNGRAITGMYFAGQKYGPDLVDCGSALPGDPWLSEAARQIGEYFGGIRDRFDVPCELDGTMFQRRVWQALAEIPFGHTITYSDLARDIGAPRAVRAVGAAIGRNPISIVVPCHRVIGANGSLTGYAGGLDRKRALLELEGRRHDLHLESQ